MPAWPALAAHIVARARLAAGISGVVLLAAGAVHAQSAPDAGSLLQQIEQGNRPRLPAQSTSPLAPPPVLRAIGGDTLEVRRFRFAGNTLIDEQQLQAVVAGFLSRPIDFATLQEAARRVAQAYREAGWVVRAYLPQQEIEDGVVTIQVVEAVLGAVRIEGTGSRVPQTQIRALVQHNQPLGRPLRADALDRALLLVDDLPGVEVSGRLAEGQNQAETDLVLSATDNAALGGELWADNTGSRATGRERLTANVQWNSPARIGDLASATLIHTRGSDYLRAAYTVPVGSDGWRLGANASHLSYQVLTAGLTQADGSSESAGLEATYPLLRSRTRNAFLALALDRKAFDNRNAGTVITRYKSHAASVTLSGNAFDDFAGGGVTNASLAYVNGRMDLAGSPHAAADAVTARTAGRFQKLRFALARQQVLTADLSLLAAVSGQRSDKNLDSSEKFYLGGVGGVRAYPASEGGGSQGQVLNLELRARLPANFSVTGFYDHGWVQVNKDNNFPGAAALNHYALRGAGVAVGWTAPSGLSVKATLARRIGSNPNPTPAGTDQDGSLIRNRFWLQLSLPF